jgi:hypothetical protein
MTTTPTQQMTTTFSESSSLFRPRPVFQRRRDWLFIWATRIAVFFSAFLLLWIALEIGIQALPAIRKFGLGFFWGAGFRITPRAPYASCLRSEAGHRLREVPNGRGFPSALGLGKPFSEPPSHRASLRSFGALTDVAADP